MTALLVLGLVDQAMPTLPPALWQGDVGERVRLTRAEKGDDDADYFQAAVRVSAKARHRRVDAAVAVSARIVQPRPLGRARDGNKCQAAHRDRRPSRPAQLDAIGDGDGPRAADLLRSHVAVQGQRFTDLVASLDAMGRAEAQQQAAA